MVNQLSHNGVLGVNELWQLALNGKYPAKALPKEWLKAEKCLMISAMSFAAFMVLLTVVVAISLVDPMA